MAVYARLDRLASLSPDGLIDFATYMDVALYDAEDGFYSRVPDRAGVRGDFVTSPELGDAFARCLWDAVRPHTERTVLVADVGGGRGTLATQLRRTAAEEGFAVETAVVDSAVAARDVAAGSGHTTAATLAGLDRTPGIVVANELLDNLGVRLMSSPVAERCVRWDGTRAEWAERRASEDLVSAVSHIPSDVWSDSVHGLVPVPVAAWGWIDDLPDAADVVLVDYGDDVASLLGRADPPVRAYRGHEAADALTAPGSADVTCEVATDLIVARLEGTGRQVTDLAQADWLEAHGLGTLREEARQAEVTAARERDTMGQLRARHRLNELNAISDRTGLGAFRVLTAGST